MSDEYDLGFVSTPENGKGLKVTVNSFRGQWYVHLREYIEDPDEEIWFPTKKGIAIKAEHVDTVAHMFSQAGELLTAVYLDVVNNVVLDNPQLKLFKEEEEE
jgi:hypothetical protein